MTFDERKMQAKRQLLDFLGSYIPPRGLDNDAQANRINQIADAFARRMPTKGDFSEMVERVFNNIRDTHMSNTWPAQGAFVLAMPQSEVMGRSAPESYTGNFLEMSAERMNNSQPVTESVVWGGIGEKLVRDGHVASEVLNRYRMGSVQTAQLTYGNAHADWMRERYGEKVNAYLGAGMAAE